MKKIFSKIKNRISAVAGTTAGAVSMTLANTMPVYATSSTGVSSTGVPIVDNGMAIIKVCAIGICEIIGVIGLVKGGMDLGTGVSQRDQSGIVQGAAEFGGGLIMAGIGVIIGLLGL